ncbi:hypothetical protein ACQKMN_18505 [Ureibacillus composti]
MDSTELRRLRLNQVAIINGLMTMILISFFIIINKFSITFSQFFLVIGVIALFQGVFGLIKGDSTKSFIPIFEKIAVYEKQKMGKEWYKQRKVGYIWQLLLSVLMFLQAYWNRDTNDHIFQFNFGFIGILLIILLSMVNISMLLHFRKVDRSNSLSDMKGYTWKSNLFSIAVGIIFTFAIFSITIFYLMSNY